MTIIASSSTEEVHVAMEVNSVWMLMIGILKVLSVEGHRCSCDCHALPQHQHQHQQHQLPVQLVYLNQGHPGHQAGTTGSQLLLYANHHEQQPPQHSHVPLNLIEQRQHPHHQYEVNENQYTPAPVNHLHQDQQQEYEALQPALSKVSSHQDNHYIKIEQHISPKLHSNKNSDEDHKDHHDKNVYYKFEYAVNDQKTHDIKNHKEERKGDVVEGEYSLLEEDGNVRTVKYYADWKNGFHANVHNSKKSS